MTAANWIDRAKRCDSCMYLQSRLLPEEAGRWRLEGVGPWFRCGNPGIFGPLDSFGVDAFTTRERLACPYYAPDAGR